MDNVQITDNRCGQLDRHEIRCWIQIVFSRLVHDPQITIATGFTIWQHSIQLARFEVLGAAGSDA